MKTFAKKVYAAITFDPEAKVVEKNGQRFDLGDQFEVDCHQLGRHDFMPDVVEPGQSRHCRHCFRTEDTNETT